MIWYDMMVGKRKTEVLGGIPALLPVSDME
jgi:hypothetical protein